jgi:hypothetical protein
VKPRSAQSYSASAAHGHARRGPCSRRAASDRWGPLSAIFELKIISKEYSSKQIATKWEKFQKTIKFGTLFIIDTSSRSPRIFNYSIGCQWTVRTNAAVTVSIHLSKQRRNRLTFHPSNRGNNKTIHEFNWQVFQFSFKSLDRICSEWAIIGKLDVTNGCR